MYFSDSDTAGEEGAGSERGYSVGLTVRSLNLFDLSHSGRQHPNVIWKSIPESAPKVPTPILSTAHTRTPAPVPVPVSAPSLPMISLNLTLPGSKVKIPPVCQRQTKEYVKFKKFSTNDFSFYLPLLIHFYFLHLFIYFYMRCLLLRFIVEVLFIIFQLFIFLLYRQFK